VGLRSDQNWASRGKPKQDFKGYRWSHFEQRNIGGVDEPEAGHGGALRSVSASCSETCSTQEYSILVPYQRHNTL